MSSKELLLHPPPPPKIVCRPRLIERRLVLPERAGSSCMQSKEGLPSSSGKSLWLKFYGLLHDEAPTQ
jgi:hypothetical protein